MNPATVLAVHCKECGNYVGQYSMLEDVQDEDDYTCKECKDGDEEAAPR